MQTNTFVNNFGGKMFNKKLTILTLLAFTLTTCSALADKGGFGNGGQGQGQEEGQEIRENFGTPGQGWHQNIQNDQRQDRQPLPEQIKRDYNQVQRQQRQLFQKNWKKIKK